MYIHTIYNMQINDDLLQDLCSLLSPQKVWRPHHEVPLLSGQDSNVRPSRKIPRDLLGFSHGTSPSSIGTSTMGHGFNN